MHGFRHTYATELATSNVSVYTLMKLLGHESMTTSQRYVTAHGAETPSAATKRAADCFPIRGDKDATSRTPIPIGLATACRTYR
ncbi:tyrosine-type recombinase/integrase [Mycobacterium sp. ITM-2016-00317]|uniref:tyrosine-type recombinase/integrase n=1 Tax=Mycobacterium sp. ITM-2016-00317 TaxID=2099694 RepID=UPI0037C81EE1